MYNCSSLTSEKVFVLGFGTSLSPNDITIKLELKRQGIQGN